MNKNKKKILITTFIIALLITSIGCLETQQKNQEPNQINNTQKYFTIKDDLGRQVKVPKNVTRVVSTAPANTETLFAINAGNKLVGVTNYADYPPKAKNITKIGGFQNPSAEKIIALNPDVVFASPVTGEKIGSMVETVGIPVVVINPSNLSHLMQDIELMGKVVGEEKKAKNLTNQMKDKINTIQEKTQGLEREKTLFIISGFGGNYWVAGENTFINELIEISGGKNVAQNITGYKRIGIETIQSWGPKNIFYPINSGLTKETLLNSSKFETIPAIEQENIYEIKEENKVLRPGPRIIEGLELIAEKIHSNVINLIQLKNIRGAIWV